MKAKLIKLYKKKLAVALLFSFASGFASAQKGPVDYVDNFSGVRDQNTSCVLGPQLPNASINPSPHTARVK